MYISYDFYDFGKAKCRNNPKTTETTNTKQPKDPSKEKENGKPRRKTAQKEKGINANKIAQLKQIQRLPKKSLRRATNIPKTTKREKEKQKEYNQNNTTKIKQKL